MQPPGLVCSKLISDPPILGHCHWIWYFCFLNARSWWWAWLRTQLLGCIAWGGEVNVGEIEAKGEKLWRWGEQRGGVGRWWELQAAREEKARLICQGAPSRHTSNYAEGVSIKGGLAWPRIWYPRLSLLLLNRPIFLWGILDFAWEGVVTYLTYSYAVWP